MAWSNTLLAIAALASISLQGVDVAKVFLKDIIPPPIEGVGSARGVGQSGKEILVDWIITKRTDCKGVSGRSWHTDSGFRLDEPLTVTTLPQSLEPIAYHISTKIPHDIEGDSVYLSIVGWYECGTEGRDFFELGPVKIKLREVRERHEQ